MTTLQPGQSLTTPGRTIGEGDINLFAGLVGDFTPIHVDEVYAKASPFGARIAHGPLTMSTAIGMLTQTGVLGERVIALLNLNWDFCGPVKVDDTIRSRVTRESRPSAKPGREGAIRSMLTATGALTWSLSIRASRAGRISNCRLPD